MIDMSKERTVIPEKVVYKPKTLTGTIPPGKTLKIETGQKDGRLLTAKAPENKSLSYSITVALKEE